MPASTTPLYIYSYRYAWENVSEFVIFESPLTEPEISDFIDELELETYSNGRDRIVAEFKLVAPSDIPPEWLDEQIENAQYEITRLGKLLERYKKLKELI